MNRMIANQSDCSIFFFFEERRNEYMKSLVEEYGWILVVLVVVLSAKTLSSELVNDVFVFLGEQFDLLNS